MNLPDTSAWSLFAHTPNCTFYSIERHILIGVLELDTKDNTESALINIERSNEYFSQHGPGIIIYCMNGILDQTFAARKIYRQGADPNLVFCAGLVVDSLLSRAIASFFTGISKPDGIAVKVVSSVDQALSWARPIYAERMKAVAEERATPE